MLVWVAASDPRRICFALEVPVLRERGDEAVFVDVAGGSDDEPWIGGAVGKCQGNARLLQQVLPGPGRQDRLAMPVLILDELEGAAVGAERRAL